MSAAAEMNRNVLLSFDLGLCGVSADDASLEAARRAVEDSLNAITSRAYAIIGKRADGGLT